jgi:hypothetical protein
LDEQLEFLKEISTRLKKAKIPYMITGSIALSIYATPRMTRDLDVVVDLQPKDADMMVRLFEKDCYVDRSAVHKAAVERGIFNIIHNRWIVKADFIVRKDEPYRKVEFERRREIDIEGVSIAVVAPEDLILSKLCWVKESESEMQQRDVKDLIRSAENLDWPYLKEWAGRLGVADLLERARSA